MRTNTHENQTASIIDTLLVEEGIVSQQDLERALEIQGGDAELAHTPLGLTLVKKGYISEKDLVTMMNHPEFQEKLGSKLMADGLLSETDWVSCQGKIQPHEPLKDMLLREGYVAKEDLHSILDHVMDGMAFGKLALKLDLVTETEIETALKYKNYKRSVTEILCELSLITISELNQVFQKHNNQPKLGEILYQQGIISKTILDAALEEQSRNRESLGNVLVRQNFITVDQLYFALSIQYNIPFRELEDFVLDEKQRLELRDILGQKFAEENMVLPLFLNGSNLTVAVFNPSRKDVLDELQRTLKHYRITFVLIRDEKFEQLFTLLYGEMLNSYRALDSAPLQKGDSECKFIITDPESDISKIKDLYNTYETLRNKTASASSDSREPLFREFINESFKHICEKFHCNRINFYVESINEQVAILAAPLLENITEPDL